MSFNPNPPPPRSTPPNPYPRNPYANPAPRTRGGGHYTRPSGQRPGKKKVPVWVWIIVGFFAVGLIATWTAEKSDGGISKLDLHYTVDDSYSLEVGESKEDYLTVSGKDNFPVDSIDFVSSNPSVAAFRFINAADEKVYFSIDALAPGSATLYAQTTDKMIKSDEIAVSVKAAPTPELTPEPTATPEPEATTEPTEESVAQGEMVWVTEYGSKYHSIPDCGSTKHASQISLERAVSRGLSPCENCH